MLISIHVSCRNRRRANLKIQTRVRKAVWEVTSGFLTTVPLSMVLLPPFRPTHSSSESNSTVVVVDVRERKEETKRELMES
ncbi:hypothetical protein BT96DRAFT_921826 [Gymnopus androsaceus JB14]|uniref:Uncharacterized protein n=1 Tax=Gymnopus androsaceus JB14 TaxID=1447944 RepID=A0A6A4HII0_9AGAR|nr:hypothetical protein BT96DRAFT_921826 [Gymnopus androsaceus JB14]